MVSLVESINSLEKEAAISEDQYVDSIINAIENPVDYTENNYINSLVESVGRLKVTKSS